MLEEPQYSSVVRWGNDGKSFVVLENEQFTKHILPKHFKHSNFASFVRQLNKYDFHKVRQNDENGQSPYGPCASEFVHPEFRADRKDGLDNIRRKAPAQRRQQQTTEDSFSAAQQMIDALGAELRQTRKDMQATQEENMKSTRLLADQVGRLRKIVTRQSQALDELISVHVDGLIEKRGEGQTAISQDEYPRHLRQTREIVDGLFQDLGNDVEKLNPLYDKYPAASEDDANGEPNGVADMYGMVPYGINGFDDRVGLLNGRGNGSTKKDIWGPRKPYILLVEDEVIAAKIAQKRLQAFACKYEYTSDGHDAVAMVNKHPHKFDLILMDIKLPTLGGIQATACIRVENHPRMPIIALTASRRPGDMTTYLKHGMDDLLPKPFSSQVFEALLRKHLPHLLPQPKYQNQDEAGRRGGGGMNGFQERPSGSMSAATMVVNTNLSNGNSNTKFEQTPIQSPAGSMSWGHSPATANQIPNASPVATNGMVNAGANGGAVMHPNGLSTTPMPAGLANGMGPTGITNGMGNMSNGVMNTIDPVTMTSLGPSSYMAAMSNAAQMSIPPIPRHFPAMHTGYGQIVDGGLDFGDERPEKRQRIYAPTDMGGYPS